MIYNYDSEINTKGHIYMIIMHIYMALRSIFLLKWHFNIKWNSCYRNKYEEYKPKMAAQLNV